MFPVGSLKFYLIAKFNCNSLIEEVVVILLIIIIINTVNINKTILILLNIIKCSGINNINNMTGV